MFCQWIINTSTYATKVAPIKTGITFEHTHIKYGIYNLSSITYLSTSDQIFKKNMNKNKYCILYKNKNK